MMARAYILAGVLSCAIAVCSAGQTISVDEGEFVFDAVMEGAFVPHTFTLTNVGDQTLEIHRVRASCGCTATALAKRTLFPYHIPAGDVNFLLCRGIGLQRPEVFAGGHLMGAVNVPFNDLGEWIPYLPENVLIIVYDEDGTLADLAVQALIDAGYRDAKSLLGGFLQWQAGFGDQFIWPPRRGE